MSHQKLHLKAEKAYAIIIFSRNRSKTNLNCTGEEEKFGQLGGTLQEKFSLFTIKTKNGREIS